MEDLIKRAEDLRKKIKKRLNNNDKAKVYKNDLSVYQNELANVEKKLRKLAKERPKAAESMACLNHVFEEIDNAKHSTIAVNDLSGDKKVTDGAVLEAETSAVLSLRKVSSETKKMVNYTSLTSLI